MQLEKESLHILLADDDEGDRLLFTEALSELKIETIVHTVNNGIELMELLNKEDTVLPHFIFLDLNMPRKNGLECLQEIRSSAKLNDICIAIYSTSNTESDMEEALSNGANIYITKPSNFTALKRILQKAVMTAYRYQDKSMIRENFLLRI